MFALSVLLPLFAMSMLVAGIMLTIAGPGMLLGGILVGMGLLLLGNGLNAFRTKTLKNMAIIPMLIPKFALSMLVGGVLLIAAGIPFLLGAVLVGLGLGFLAAGLNAYRSRTIKVMHLIGGALVALAVNLMIAAIPLMIGGALFLPLSLIHISEPTRPY